jgi:hypothetical protein
LPVGFVINGNATSGHLGMTCRLPHRGSRVSEGWRNPCNASRRCAGKCRLSTLSC